LTDWVGLLPSVIPNLIWDPEPQRLSKKRDAAHLDPDFHQDDEEKAGASPPVNEHPRQFEGQETDRRDGGEQGDQFEPDGQRLVARFRRFGRQIGHRHSFNCRRNPDACRHRRRGENRDRPCQRTANMTMPGAIDAFLPADLASAATKLT
jgi:hypothetical protein